MTADQISRALDELALPHTMPEPILDTSARELVDLLDRSYFGLEYVETKTPSKTPPKTPPKRVSHASS
jgi:hypothetical protein